MRWQLIIPMMAILNPRIQSATWRWLAAVIFLCVAGGLVFADGSRNPAFARRAEAEFHRTQAQFLSRTNDPAAAWQFARACFDLADFAINDTERATLAIQGIAACRQTLAQQPKSAPGYYYLGMNLGQLARTELLGALKLVKQMESEFKMADNLDAHFDYAGPARCLGLLYRDAPGWPTSIGSRHKAREWLERAVQLAPDYPENHLNLVESRLQWNDRPDAKNELKKLDALWPSAQTNLVGEAWESSWTDWSNRCEAARKQLDGSNLPAIPPKNSR